MKTPKLSKTSSKALPNNTHPPLKEWVPYRVYDVTYGGLSFKAARDGAGFVYAGRELQASKGTSSYYYDSREIQKWECQLGSSYLEEDQSCAFKRLTPLFLTPNDSRPSKELYPIFSWYLKALPFHKGTTCYVTKDDGPSRFMLEALKARGFIHAATNRSNHGNYRVHLLVHPGDKQYKKNNTEKDSLSFDRNEEF